MEIYLVFRNSDMTEGRGPMIFDSAFLSKKKAEEYVDEKPGVMGRKMKWSERKYGDWEIRTVQTKD
jgi:hypothetical protein